MSSGRCQRCDGDVSMTLTLGAMVGATMFCVAWYFIAWKVLLRRHTKSAVEEVEEEAKDGGKDTRVQKILARMHMATLARRLGQVYHLVRARTTLLQKMANLVRADATRRDALPVQGLLKILIGFFQTLHPNP